MRALAGISHKAGQTGEFCKHLRSYYFVFSACNSRFMTAKISVVASPADT